MSGQVILGVLNGLGFGCSIFLVAAGVTLIFGILKILNFAHGGFLTIGAYIAYSVIGSGEPTTAKFALACAAAAATVGVLGFLTQVTLFRRLDGLDESSTLIATFALLLVCDGVVKLVWGLDYHSVAAPPGLSAVVEFGTLIVPVYTVFVIGSGVVVFAMLDLGIHRLWLGKKIQAVAADRWMSAVLGLDTRLLFTGTVVLAFALAGLAGGLLLPNQTLSPALSGTFLLTAFMVVIIGGLGNIRGAFAAALVIGIAENLSYLVLPAFPGLPGYVLMAVMLLLRPQGLFSSTARPPQAVGPGPRRLPALSLRSDTQWVIGIVVAAALASLPFWAGQGMLFSCGVAIIMALFAASWNLLFGFVGIASFGHAAFFALGAYTVGLGLQANTQPLVLLLPAAVLLTAAVALVIGLVALHRATGIAFAIFTLAVSEILRGALISDSRFGSDDGLPVRAVRFGLEPASLGLPPASLLFWLILITSGLGAAVLWLAVHSQFGRVLSGIRQDAARAEFLGINVRRFQLAAFVLSGGIAGLGGGLLAPWVRIISPELSHYAISTQPMLASLLGGTAFFWGPAVGTAIFAVLAIWTRTLAGASDLISGLVLLGIVYAAPSGVMGLFGHVLARVTRRAA